ncbi:4261_t:CDS:2, partial [Acaulospora colombiana]
MKLINLSLWKSTRRKPIFFHRVNKDFVKLATPHSPSPSTSIPKPPITPVRKRTPRTRLTPSTRSRLVTPTPRTNNSTKSSADSPISPLHIGSLLQLLKSCKRRSPKSILKKEVLKLDVIGNDWVGTTPPKRKRTKSLCDRFIPAREMGEPSHQFNVAHREHGKESYMGSAELEYQEKLAEACGIALNKRILSFKVEPPSSQKEDLRKIYKTPLKTTSINMRRRIMTVPERILDAPGMIDDYYLNLLDWSIKNMVAIGLYQNVYVWNADTGDVKSFAQTSNNDYISSLSWSMDGEYLAVGTSDGDTQIWDALREQKIRSMLGHVSRVGVVTWNKHIVSSGCKDGSIWNHDTRIAQHRVSELLDHSSEVCGLKWRHDGEQLASGGNDNRVNIWDARSSVPQFTKTNHTAAVK